MAAADQEPGSDRDEAEGDEVEPPEVPARQPESEPSEPESEPPGTGNMPEAVDESDRANGSELDVPPVLPPAEHRPTLAEYQEKLARLLAQHPKAV